MLARIVLALCLVAAVCGCSKAKSQLKQARQLEEREQWQQAVLRYQQVAPLLTHDPRLQAAAYAGLGHCLTALEHPQDALDALQHALVLDPGNADAHLHMADLLLSADAPEDALPHIKFVLQRDGHSAAALASLGSYYALKGDAEAAGTTLRQAFAIDPRQPKLAEKLANLYLRDDKVDEARGVLRAAAAARPKSAAPRLAMGRLEEQEGDVKAAESDYRDAFAAEPNTETTLRLADFLARNSRIAEADQVLQQLEKQGGSEPFALADFEVTSGRATEGLEHYQQLLARLANRPDRTELSQAAARSIEAALAANGDTNAARLHLEHLRGFLSPRTASLLAAEIALAKGDVPAADKLVREASKNGGSAAADYLAGVVAYQSGYQQEAQRHWEEAIKADGSYAPAGTALAALELERGKLIEAEEYASAVVRLEPANFDALILYARILAAQERFDSARSIVGRAQALRDNAAEPHLVLGDVALRQQHTADAFIEFEKAVVLDPSSRDAVGGLARVFRLGRVDRSMLGKLEAAAEREPRSATLYEIAGRLYAEHHWNEDAARCLRRAAELRSLHAVAGVGGAAAGPVVEDSERGYLAAIAAGDPSGVAANNLAWIYAQRGSNLDRALQLAEQANASRPLDPAVLDTLGVVRMKRRELTEAIDCFKRAKELLRKQSGSAPELLASLDAHLAEANRLAGKPAPTSVLPN